MTRINPLDPTTWVPRTGNPYLDEQIDQGLGRVGAAILERMDPATQRLIGTVRAAGAYVAPANVVANPAEAGPDGDKGRFVRELVARPDGLLVTIGRRGSGKTAFDLMLAQKYHDARRPVFVVGMPQQVLDRFGFQELQPEDLGTLPNKCVVVIDDVALFFNTRTYAKAGLLHKLIIESRHRNIVVLVNAHNSALVDKYLLEATAIFLKPSSSLTPELQRTGLRPLVQRADAAFRQISRAQRLSRMYAYSDELEYEGMLQYTLPRGWSQAVSQHHAAGRGALASSQPEPKKGRRRGP